jgi:hypothetical protein
MEDTNMATAPNESNIAIDFNTDALLADLNRTAKQRFKLNRWFRPLGCVGSVYFAGYWLCISWLHLPVPATYAPALDLLHNVALGIIFFTTLSEFVLPKQQQKSKVSLAQIVNALSADSRAVGALAQLCHSTYVLSVADVALGPLLKLLPFVKVSDARYISDSQMEALLALLTVTIADRKEEEARTLPLAILKALEQIGDSRAIEPVRRLTTGKRNILLHHAAQECLTVLEKQAEKREYDRSLLLPASTEGSKEILLRAAGGGVEMQPDLLLRAVADKK